MLGLQQLLRLFNINRILVKHGLDEILLATHLFRPLRFLFYLSPWRWFGEHPASRGERIRKTLEDLGPIFVKFGQILSTRRDLLPDDIADELARLQDQVPSFPSELAKKIVEKAYGKPLNEVFSVFDEAPLASASIAQVHAAQLHNGRKVVVKVVRPEIEKLIRRDLQLLYTIAELAQRFWKDGRRLRPLEVVAEYEKTIIDELDLMREAASASQLRRNFQDSQLLYVPEIYWPLARKNVIVMERIEGIPVGDTATLQANNIDLPQLSEHGVEIFFTQVFRDSFFHADMHPGNIFVSPKGQYLAVDFGIMGTLSPEDQRYLAENFLAFFKRDYRRVAELHVESGWVPNSTRVDEFESAIRTVCEPIFEKPLKDISFGQLLLRLFQTARRFNMTVQPQLVLLQKTLLNIEGLGRQLNPELDLWKTAKPFLERWMSEQVGLRSFMRNIKEYGPQWTEKLPQIPTLIYDVLQQAKDQQNRRDDMLQQHLDMLGKQIQEANKRTYQAIVAAACLLASVLMLTSQKDIIPATFAGVPLITWMLGGFAAFLVIFSWPSRSK